MNSVFQIKKPTDPAKAVPFIFDSPHSGTHYPDDFHYACSFNELKKAEDNYVDELFDFVPDLGASLLTANFPRSYIDPNRAEDDIDPLVVQGEWPEPTFPSAKSDAGIGLIRRLIAQGIPVYDAPLAPEEITRRIEHYYLPYHAALAELIEETHARFGEVYYINCHSMPSDSAAPRTPIDKNGSAVDICLGTLDGMSCSVTFAQKLRTVLRDMGYSVSMNDPFKGAELVRRHSRPAAGRHAIQIEINKALYMDEETGEKYSGLIKLKTELKNIFETL